MTFYFWQGIQLRYSFMVNKIIVFNCTLVPGNNSRGLKIKVEVSGVKLPRVTSM